MRGVNVHSSNNGVTPLLPPPAAHTHIYTHTQLFGSVACLAPAVAPTSMPLPPFPSSPQKQIPHSPHLAQVTKNWQPLVLGPLLALDSSPGPVWRAVKGSSANLLP